MHGDLSLIEMRDTLSSVYYGHLGFKHDDRMQILPITYAFHEHAIYSFSFHGTKVDAMRAEPNVCFQVEQILSSDHWRSVMLWGKYEELSGEEAAEGMNLLLDRLYTEGVNHKSIFLPFRHSKEAMIKAAQNMDTIVYRINISEMIGRFEQYQD